jgi:hypothetical protein
MPGKDDDRITRLLRRVNDDAEGSMDDLMSAVYEDLCRVAERHMVQEFGRGLPGVTMEPSALVNESFLRIIKQRNTYDNRGQFFAIAARPSAAAIASGSRWPWTSTRNPAAAPAPRPSSASRPSSRPSTAWRRWTSARRTWSS